MIISKKHRFIFIKSIKTASTSVEIFLSRFAGVEDIITYLPPPDEAMRQKIGARGPQNCFNSPIKRIGNRFLGQSRHDSRYQFHHNMNASQLRRLLRIEWNSYLKFTIVRNPFDRAISKFFNDHKNEAIRRQQEVRPHLNSKINDYICALPDTDLTNWHLYTHEDKVIVDEVVRYENLEQDLARVLGNLGLSEPVELPHAKGAWRLDRSHYSQVLNSDARIRIESAAFQEIAAFGYSWKDA